jgi:hypothetical protein
MPRGGRALWTNVLMFRGTEKMEHWLKEKAKEQNTSYSYLLRLMVVRAMNEEGFNIRRELKRLLLEARS